MTVANKQNTKLYLESYLETEIKIVAGTNDLGSLIVDENGNNIKNQGEQLIYSCSSEQGLTDTNRILIYDSSDPPQFMMASGTFNTKTKSFNSLWGSMYIKNGKTINYKVRAKN